MRSQVNPLGCGIRSLQDSSTWRESSSQSGATLGYGNGAVTGASASGGKDRHPQRLRLGGEQSGIRAGDGGFQVDVQGRTELIGGAITSTQAAVDLQRNRFESEGGLSTSDLHNSASFEATSVGVSVGVGCRWVQVVEDKVAGVCSEGPSDEPTALKEWTLIAVDNKR